MERSELTDGERQELNRLRTELALARDFAAKVLSTADDDAQRWSQLKLHARAVYLGVTERNLAAYQQVREAIDDE